MGAGIDGLLAHLTLHEAHAHVVVGGRPRHHVGADAVFALQMPYAARHAYRIVGAEHEAGRERHELGIGEDGLHAVVAHDAVAGLGHDHVEAAAGELGEDGVGHLVGTVLAGTDRTGVG